MRGKSVLTSDAQHDPRFASGTVVLQGVRSVLAVPLGVENKVFGIIYADSPIAEGRFTEDHLKVLTTLASVAAIRVENARLMEARSAAGTTRTRVAIGQRDPAAPAADGSARRSMDTNCRASASLAMRSAVTTMISLSAKMDVW